MALTEYNFQYLLDISHTDDKNYELNKIMNKIDQELSGKLSNKYLFHLIPIVFSITIVSGISVYTYILSTLCF